VAALAVVPLGPDDEPEAVAARITLEPAAGGGVTAILPALSGPVTIRAGHGPVVFQRTEPAEKAR
jgi:hypothetical protein